MKKKLITLLLFVIASQLSSQENNEPKPVFPEIIKQFPTARDFTISPMQDELYFTAQGYSGELSTIIKVVKKGDSWSSPEIAPFSGRFKDMEAMFSPDGLKLFFVSNRPIKKSTTATKDFDIWFIHRSNTSSEWSAPKNIGSPINTKGDEFYPSQSINGNLYFTGTASTSKGKDDIFVSKWENNQYLSPVSLSESINSEGYEYNSYIAPDESFLIFGGYKRKDGLGSGDLYISYQNKDGIWSKAKNLSKRVNSDKMDYCPFYLEKTHTLYFTSKRNTINDNNRTSESIKQLLEVMNSYQNGLSRIYSVSLKL
ncbi:TolB-like translocation protein [Aquimarina sediminis]|uniref:PD40 domain-containing protein n=1 Tax=Aquimarina sediminis TaxID=2070536 RepID=UPI000CA00B8C|nr:PD40 domain-containing protein [Aquimarina sediminis]